MMTNTKTRLKESTETKAINTSYIKLLWHSSKVSKIVCKYNGRGTFLDITQNYFKKNEITPQLFKNQK